MARLAFALFACVLSGAAGEESWAVHEKSINLNRPGTLEWLQRANPQHHGKIVQILERVQKYPQSGPAYWLPAGVNASRVMYLDALMTASLPPQQDLRFSIDNVQYSVRITRFDLVRAAKVP